jgi:hypothetical protein
LLIIEPTFSSALASGSVIPQLRAQIDTAIAALPLSYRAVPYKGEIVESKETVLQYLQDWAFTYSFAIAIESGTANRTCFEYVHYRKKTRNIQKTAEVDRVCTEMKIQTRNCKFEIYISQQQQLGSR